jgi:hypothetical protein
MLKYHGKNSDGFSFSFHRILRLHSTASLYPLSFLILAIISVGVDCSDDSMGRLPGLLCAVQRVVVDKPLVSYGEVSSCSRLRFRFHRVTRTDTRLVVSKSLQILFWLYV